MQRRHVTPIRSSPPVRNECRPRFIVSVSLNWKLFCVKSMGCQNSTPNRLDAASDADVRRLRRGVACLAVLRTKPKVNSFSVWFETIHVWARLNSWLRNGIGMVERRPDV